MLIRTVSKQACCEFIEKKSRFIASVKPVDSEDDALKFIHSIRTLHWDASHNVYAYRTGGENFLQRMSDDGEPAGTAGIPVLEAVKRHDLLNTAVVVTRYFGGILLGASGLARAYGKCASLGIEAAGIIRKAPCTEIKITVEYPLLSHVTGICRKRRLSVSDAKYGQDVEICLAVPVEDVDAFEADIANATCGRALLERGGCVIVQVEDRTMS